MHADPTGPQLARSQVDPRYLGARVTERLRPERAEVAQGTRDDRYMPGEGRLRRHG
jgi:hypothetical protein